MKLYRTTKGLVVEQSGNYYLSKHTDWDVFINRSNLYFEVQREIQELTPNYDYKAFITNNLLPPVLSQEVWASGVTYLRSRNARMEESKEAAGDSFYDRVYDAERPELFFKSMPHRVVGHKQEVRIRRDSKWNVPEPELTLFINTFGEIAGYTIGNDMSSRDIEGENPLYLPQAKTYEGSAALGPCLLVIDEPISLETSIRLDIFRKEKMIFHESIQLNKMKRSPKELASYLVKELSFPKGCYLMTGTGIVPKNGFTLQLEDEIRISIEGIGQLINTVSCKNKA